ncbi:MAG: endolytic transglycosylase MltG [Cytophagales bacterium]|nr:MAG: endolytic transglycosylase MltG [Cytophagales bacterium]
MWQKIVEKLKNRNTQIGIAVAFFTFSTAALVYIYQILYTANFQVGKKEMYLYIPQNATFQTLLDSLEKHKIVHEKLSFAFLAKLMNYQDNIKAGRYKIEPNMGNLALIRMLRNGEQAPLEVGFHNARVKQDLAKKVSKYLNFSEAALLSLLEKPEIAKKYGFDTTNIMCMFLPNTYQLYWTTSPERFLERMHHEYEKFWTESQRQKAKKIGLTPIEVGILASIVQAESNKEDEKPRVAGVYINRLKKNMLLQADPTVIFAWRDFSIKRVLEKHILINSPYNTYKNKGLPPGPINLPSVASINAVLNYETHSYLYFCAKEDFSGYHNFANDLATHNRNAQKYQNALNKKGIYK